MTHALTALVTGVAGCASGVVVPLLIRSVPPVEVDPRDPDDPGPDDPGPDDPGSDDPDPGHDVDPPATDGRVDVGVVADGAGVRVGAVVASGAVGAALGLALGWTWPLLYLLPLVPICVALALIDWHTRILPSRLIYPAYPLVVVGMLVTWLLAGRPDGTASLLRAVLGLAIGFGFFYVVWFVYPRGMGFGDVRLAGVLGLALGYLGWAQLAVGLYAGFLLGGVIGGALSLARIVDRKGYPFGPFMLVGALIGVTLGEPLLSALVG